MMMSGMQHTFGSELQPPPPMKHFPTQHLMQDQAASGGCVVCGKPTFDGQPGYCSEYCAEQAMSMQEAAGDQLHGDSLPVGTYPIDALRLGDSHQEVDESQYEPMPPLSSLREVDLSSPQFSAALQSMQPRSAEVPPTQTVWQPQQPYTAPSQRATYHSGQDAGAAERSMYDSTNNPWHSASGELDRCQRLPPFQPPPSAHKIPQRAPSMEGLAPGKPTTPPSVEKRLFTSPSVQVEPLPPTVSFQNVSGSFRSGADGSWVHVEPTAVPLERSPVEGPVVPPTQSSLPMVPPTQMLRGSDNRYGNAFAAARAAADYLPSVLPAARVSIGAPRALAQAAPLAAVPVKRHGLEEQSDFGYLVGGGFHKQRLEPHFHNDAWFLAAPVDYKGVEKREMDARVQDRIQSADAYLDRLYDHGQLPDLPKARRDADDCPIA